jgi:hypothetical protein
MVIGNSNMLQVSRSVGGRARWADLCERAFYRCSPPTAWMTNCLFEEWLKAFDSKLSHPSLLLVDNASVHNTSADRLNLRHVRLEFLHPNVTSRVQPADQGTIRSVKAMYRSLLLPVFFNILSRDRLPNKRDKDYNQHTNPFLASNFSMLDVLDLMLLSLKNLPPYTIRKCWCKAEFLSPERQSALHNMNISEMFQRNSTRD